MAFESHGFRGAAPPDHDEKSSHNQASTEQNCVRPLAQWRALPEASRQVAYSIRNQGTRNPMLPPAASGTSIDVPDGMPRTSTSGRSSRPGSLTNPLRPGTEVANGCSAGRAATGEALALFFVWDRELVEEERYAAGRYDPWRAGRESNRLSNPRSSWRPKREKSRAISRLPRRKLRSTVAMVQLVEPRRGMSAASTIACHWDFMREDELRLG